MTEGSLVGVEGTLTVATRGREGPGEVVLPAGGGTEAYRAWSDVPIARGVIVVVYDMRGARAVSVAAINDSEV